MTSAARLLEMSGTEYMMRAKGYVKSPKDLENTVIGTDGSGTPVLVKNVADRCNRAGYSERRGGSRRRRVIRSAESS